MKRILLAVIGTVAGLVGLLSFKTSQPETGTGALPSSGLPTGTTSSGSTSSAPSSTATGSSANSKTAPTKTTGATKTFLGSAVRTRYGIVQVRVTVSGKRITEVSFAKLTAFDRRSQQINDAAGPQLLDETLSAQSAHIDTVSGASYTSAGYEQSLQSALDAAGI